MRGCDNITQNRVIFVDRTTGTRATGPGAAQAPASARGNTATRHASRRTHDAYCIYTIDRK